jgi:hypothetical protein
MLARFAGEPGAQAAVDPRHAAGENRRTFMSHRKSAGLARRLVIGGAITVACLAAGAGIAEAATSGGSSGASSGSSASRSATTQSAATAQSPLATTRQGSPNAKPGPGSTAPMAGHCEHMGKAAKSASASAYYG